MANRSYFIGTEDSTHTGIPRAKPRQVDFHVFKTEYWRRFPSKLTKDISLELIFAEIMGVIKGSISSENTLAPLSRDQYRETSCRIAPTFTTDAQRSKTYEIYENYENLKRKRGDIDQADRVLALLRVVKNNPLLSHQLGQAFDSVYIDGQHQIPS